VESVFKSLKADLGWRRDRVTRRDVTIALFEPINGLPQPATQTLGLGLESTRGLPTKGA
jgi:hypothetical protein